MNLNRRISAFSKLGKHLIKISANYENSIISNNQISQNEELIRLLITESKLYNAWYTPKSVAYMLNEIGKSLSKEFLEKWIALYQPRIENNKTSKVVAVVMAGNIPAVGFSDFLSVLISGNSLLAKLSSDDNKLLPAIAKLLLSIEPEFEHRFEFTESQLRSFDAVIATGSDNSSRYFEHYFGKYPHIIRKNRNGVAILDGTETEIELESLCEDIFLYYGLGCRNVSKIFVPKNYNFLKLLAVLEAKKEVNENNKYFNNYEYNKAIYLVNGVSHFDTGNILILENEQFVSPVSVLYYSFYENKNEVYSWLESEKDKIQCIVGSKNEFIHTIPFGTSQQPKLWDYADGVDVMEFLLSID